MANPNVGKVRLESIPLNVDAQNLDGPEAALEALLEALKSIPIDRLKNLRAAEITIVR